MTWRRHFYRRRSSVIKRPDVQKKIANERELDHRVRDNARRVLARYRAFAAKKPFAPPQRDPISDRDIFREIQHLLAKQDTVRLTRHRPPPVIPERQTSRRSSSLTTTAQQMRQQEGSRRRSSQPITKIHRAHPIHECVWKVIVSQAASRRRRDERDYTFWVPRWEDIGPSLKMLAWVMTCYKQYGYAMSLNISSQVITAAQTNERRSVVEFHAIGTP